MTASSATLAEEIASLQAEVKALDKAVAESAVQLVEKAKNHLYKFYRPNLHKEAPAKELTDEEKLLAASGASDMIATDAPVMIAGTTQTVFVQLKDDAAPPPPPETWGAYQKKDGKSNGVLALMDMLIKDLADGITESKHEEETAQKDYERLMSESQTTREQSVESITSKEAAKADLDTKIEATKESKTGQEAELSNIKNMIAQLHANCDFLLENYDLRKTARTNEVESLKNAKSVLSGASFA